MFRQQKINNYQVHRKENPRDLGQIRNNEVKRGHLHSRKKPKHVAKAQDRMDEPQQEVSARTTWEILKFIFDCMRSLNRAQVIALIFLFLFASAYALDAKNNTSRNKNSKPKPKDINRHSAKHATMAAVCESKHLHTTNKPNITLGGDHGEYLPAVCLQAEKINECHEQKQILARFRPNYSTLDKQRFKSEQDHIGWRIAHNKHLDQIQKQLDKDQLPVFLNLYNQIVSLKNVFISADNAHNAGGGNCGEHTNIALKRLMRAKIQNGMEVKIQTVTLFASQSNQPIRDHYFLILDSNAGDVSINASPNRVKTYLDSINEGKICDPWNHGYFADYKSDASGFYNMNAGWDGIRVKTYKLDFARFDTLTQSAKTFICEQLTEMGLYSESCYSCRLFKPTESKRATPKDQLIPEAAKVY